MKKRDTWLTFFLILAVIGVVSVKIDSCNKESRTQKENTQLINALYDTIRYWKSSDSTKTATISVIQTESDNAFTNLMISNNEIMKLQDIVKTYQGRLKPGSSVTHAIIETKIKDTGKPVIVKQDTIKWEKSYYIFPTYLDTLHNKWIDYSVTIKKDTSIRDIKIKNEFSAVVGVDKKTKKPFVDLTTENPYSSVKTLRTYQVAVPKQKRFSLSISAGMNFLPSFENDLLKPTLKVQPYLGAGIGYRLINLF